MPKKERMNPLAVQKTAVTFMSDYIAKHPLGLPESLTHEQFDHAMQGITRAMVNAWGDGYYTAREGR